MKLQAIHKLRDEIIHLIFKASSLSVNDPAKHLTDLVNENPNDPKITSKRITLDEFQELLMYKQESNFSFYPGSASLAIGQGSSNMGVLMKKLVKAGMENQFESMKRRALSAEFGFLEMTAKEADPAKLNALLDQVEGVVISECEDALLENSSINGIDGFAAMQSVRRQFRHIAEKTPERVKGQSNDCLVGVAGLLTGECKIWWTEKFDLEDGL